MNLIRTIEFRRHRLFSDINDNKQPFTLFEPDENPTDLSENIFKQLCEWIRDFSNEAAKIKSPLVLDSVLHLHDLLNEIQLELVPDHVLAGVVPSSVAYTCLSSNLYYLDSFGQLLFTYIKLCNFTSNNNESTDKRLTRLYFIDFIKVCCENKIQLVNSALLTRQCRSLVASRAISSCSITHNLYMTPYVMSFIKERKNVTLPSVMDVCSLSFPNLHLLFDVYFNEE